MFLGCTAGGELVGLLFLHLSRVPGLEGGVSWDVSGDHQWPDTKGGIRPHSHNLLPQEVSCHPRRDRAPLRTGTKGEEIWRWEKARGRPDPLARNRTALICQHARLGWNILMTQRQKQKELSTETWKIKGRWILPCCQQSHYRDEAFGNTHPCPKDNDGVFYGDKAIHFLDGVTYIE